MQRPHVDLTGYGSGHSLGKSEKEIDEPGQSQVLVHDDDAPNPNPDVLLVDYAKGIRNHADNITSEQMELEKFNEIKNKKDIDMNELDKENSVDQIELKFADIKIDIDELDKEKSIDGMNIQNNKDEIDMKESKYKDDSPEQPVDEYEFAKRLDDAKETKIDITDSVDIDAFAERDTYINDPTESHDSLGQKFSLLSTETLNQSSDSQKDLSTKQHSETAYLSGEVMSDIGTSDLNMDSELLLDSLASHEESANRKLNLIRHQQSNPETGGLNSEVLLVEFVTSESIKGPRNLDDILSHQRSSATFTRGEKTSELSDDQSMKSNRQFMEEQIEFDDLLRESVYNYDGTENSEKEDDHSNDLSQSHSDSDDKVVNTEESIEDSEAEFLKLKDNKTAKLNEDLRTNIPRENSPSSTKPVVEDLATIYNNMIEKMKITVTLAEREVETASAEKTGSIKSFELKEQEILKEQEMLKEQKILDSTRNLIDRMNATKIVTDTEEAQKLTDTDMPFDADNLKDTEVAEVSSIGQEKSQLPTAPENAEKYDDLVIPDKDKDIESEFNKRDTIFGLQDIASHMASVDTHNIDNESSEYTSFGELETREVLSKQEIQLMVVSTKDDLKRRSGIAQDLNLSTNYLEDALDLSHHNFEINPNNIDIEPRITESVDIVHRGLFNVNYEDIEKLDDIIKTDRMHEDTPSYDKKPSLTGSKPSPAKIEAVDTVESVETNIQFHVESLSHSTNPESSSSDVRKNFTEELNYLAGDPQFKYLDAVSPTDKAAKDPVEASDKSGDTIIAVTDMSSSNLAGQSKSMVVIEHDSMSSSVLYEDSHICVKKPEREESGLSALNTLSETNDFNRRNSYGQIVERKQVESGPVIKDQQSNANDAVISNQQFNTDITEQSNVHLGDLIEKNASIHLDQKNKSRTALNAQEIEVMNAELGKTSGHVEFKEAEDDGSNDLQPGTDSQEPVRDAKTEEDKDATTGVTNVEFTAHSNQILEPIAIRSNAAGNVVANLSGQLPDPSRSVHSIYMQPNTSTPGAISHNVMNETFRLVHVPVRHDPEEPIKHILKSSDSGPQNPSTEQNVINPATTSDLTKRESVGTPEISRTVKKEDISKQESDEVLKVKRQPSMKEIIGGSLLKVSSKVIVAAAEVVTTSETIVVPGSKLHPTDITAPLHDLSKVSEKAAEMKKKVSITEAVQKIEPHDFGNLPDTEPKELTVETALPPKAEKVSSKTSNKPSKEEVSMHTLPEAVEKSKRGRILRTPEPKRAKRSSSQGSKISRVSTQELPISDSRSSQKNRRTPQVSRSRLTRSSRSGTRSRFKRFADACAKFFHVNKWFRRRST